MAVSNRENKELNTAENDMKASRRLYFHDRNLKVPEDRNLNH